MFGWEFPPHISGGLGTACYGLVKSLIEENVQILFIVPKAHGDEAIKLVSASDIDIKEQSATEGPKIFSSPSLSSSMIENVLLKIDVPSSLSPYGNVETGKASEVIQHWGWQFPVQIVSKEKAITDKGKRYEFTGGYGPSLLLEVTRYAQVASTIAKQFKFDIIHAHDWLTYMAGIEAKHVSGKPLVIHVHATEYDRSGEEHIDTRVFEIEKKGMEEADLIIAVSQWTKNIIVNKYKIRHEKVKVVHNGVAHVEKSDFSIIPKISDFIVTFLGRITYQKGPHYFIEAAKKVLRYFPDAHFIMAGSGDLLPDMIELAAASKISSRVHFTGFIKGRQIQQVWSVSDVFVMPSVSEPFGIVPLEAVQAGIPVIVSNQSGVAEVLDHAIKVDFWDTDALASAIINVLIHKSLSKSLRENGKEQLGAITWSLAAEKINNLYNDVHHANQLKKISEPLLSGASA